MEVRSLLSALFATTVGFSAPSTAWAADDNPQDQDILVTGQRPANQSISGTKTASPVAETPQSVSVVTGQEIAARGVQSLSTALELTAGVTPNLRGANADVLDLFKLRGFNVTQYLDGLPLASAQAGFAAPQVDLSLVDRIEVLKGSASALYGQASPGGLIALSSKLPIDAPSYGRVAGTYGSFDLYRLDVDTGGRAGDSVLYRVYGSVNGADTQQRFGKRRRYTASAALTVGSGSPTTLTLLGNYSHDPDNGNYGVVPRSGSLSANPNGWIPRNFSDGDPLSTKYKRHQGSITYLLDHTLGSGWAFHSRGRYVDVGLKITGPVTLGLPIDASQAVFARIAGGQREKLRNATFDNQLTGTINTGPMTHTLLFGAEAQFAQSLQTSAIAFVGVPPINAFDPVYGVPIPIPAPQTDYDNHQRQIGAYAQDQIAIGDLLLTASGRYDWVRSRAHERLTDQRQSKNDERFTWRVGALYKLPWGMAPYVSYATSFQPQSAILEDGSIADPSHGRQLEIGAKYQPKGTNILLSAAWFDIVQSNVVATNPITNVSTQAGRVKSRGFELEAKVPVYEGLLLTANYGRQKVRNVRDENPFAVGYPLIGTTRDGGGLFARYTVQDGALAGLGFGGGVRYVGKGYGGFYQSQTFAIVQAYVPSYTLFDASVSYDLGRADSRLAGLTAQVNASNVGDKRYVSSCNLSGVDWCWYGSRRTILGTIAYRW